MLKAPVMRDESNHDQRVVRLVCAVLFIFFLLLSGCESATDAVADPQLDAWRSELVVSVEPEGAVTIEDARKSLQGITDDEKSEVVADEESDVETAATEASVDEESAAATDTSPQDIVLVARVGNREIPQWWNEKLATLVVSEGAPDSHYNAGPDHDPTECPFCRSRWKNEDSMALVRFVDSAGVTIPADARQLLNVAAEDFLVIHGTGELDEDSMLNIAAREVYIRPPAE